MYDAVVEVIPLRGLFSIIMKTICLERTGEGCALAGEIIAPDHTLMIIILITIAEKPLRIIKVAAILLRELI